MTDQATPNAIQHIDSLSANEFTLELDGIPVPGVLRISGFHSFKLELRPALTRQIQEPFTIAKLVQHDSQAPFNQWLKETILAQADMVRPTRTLAIVAIDDGRETRRWTIRDAWIIAITYSDFDMGSFDLVEERLTVVFDRIDETWFG